MDSGDNNTTAGPELPETVREKNYSDKLSPGVKNVVSGGSVAQDAAGTNVTSGTVPVRITVSEVERAAVEDELATIGYNLSNSIARKGADGFQAVGTIAKDDIEKLAKHPHVDSVSLVRPPIHSSASTSNTVVSEGSYDINADLAHERNVTGDGVDVAIIDWGFDENNSEIASNVVSEKTFKPSWASKPTDTSHGTAAAEVVVDTAPNANLHLLNVYNYESYDDAITWAINNDIEVISSSVIFFRGVNGFKGVYGTAHWNNRAANNGITVVQSAGNFAQKHWEGSYTDSNANNWTEFSGDVEINRFQSCGGRVVGMLSWNGWPASDQDYDLYLYNVTDNGLKGYDYSSRPQTGYEKPRETIDVNLPSQCSQYAWAIRKHNASGNAQLELYQYGGRNIEYQVPQSSLSPGATAPGAFAVGAIDHDTESLKSYSSRGPTNDGRQKPNVVGPSHVSTSSYNYEFTGTSAAAPHVAGAATLLESYSPERTNFEHMATMEVTADSLGYPSGSNKVGSGLVDVYAALELYDDTPPTTVSNLTSPSHTVGSSSSDRTVDVTWGPATDDVTGVSGYSVTWDHSATTLPDNVTDVRNTTSLTSSSLENGSWYVHVRSVDENGNWDDEAAHLGPFEIGTQTQAPSISNFDASNPDGQRLTVQFDSTESLTDVQVEVTDADGQTVGTLTEADFAETNGTYTATTDLSRDGQYTATLTAAVDTDGNDGAGGESDTVSISTTDAVVQVESRTTSVQQSVPVNVTLSDAPTGLSGYAINVTVENATIAGVTDAQVGNEFDIGNVSISDDNQTVRLKGVDIEDTVTSNASNVSLGQLVLNGNQSGTTNVTVTAAQFDDDSGNQLTPKTVGGELTVSTVVPLDSNLSTPTDPDRDGRFEDVNGNTREDFDDIVTLFEHFDDPEVQNYASAYDFNENSRRDYDDIVSLFHEVSGSGTQTASGSTTVDQTATTDSTPALTVTDAKMDVGQTATSKIVLSQAPEGLAGYKINVTVDDGNVSSISNVTVSDEFSFEDVSISEDGTTATLSGVDISDNIQSGATNVTLGQVTLTGVESGTTDVTVNPVQLDDDGGGKITPTVDAGRVAVGDTNTPTISNFTAEASDDGNLTVQFDASEQLERVSVTVASNESTEVTTLTEANFTETNGTYAATVDLADGRYTARLTTATDKAGNDGADGQADSAVVDTRSPSVEPVRPTGVVDTAAPTVTANLSDELSGVDATATSLLVDGTPVDSNATVTDSSVIYNATGLSDGIHNVTVVATDNDGNQNKRTWSFTVDTTAPEITDIALNETTVAPGASVGIAVDVAESTTGVAGVTVNGTSLSPATDGQWSGTITTPSSPGEYEISVVARDEAGNRVSRTASLTVEDGLPTAVAGQNRTASVGESITVNASNSSDDVGIASYDWDFGDGTTASGATATHAYASPGTYTVTLTVTDTAGQTATDTFTVTVPDEASPSITNFTATSSDGQQLTVRFDSDEQLDDVRVDVTDADGAIVTTLTEANFTPTNGTYATTVNLDHDGQVTATLVTATDRAGNDGSTGQTDTASLATPDTASPSISGYAVTNDGRNLTVQFTANESLTTIDVAVTNDSGDVVTTLSRDAFAVSENEYSATTTVDSDGTYTVTLRRAADAAGNDGADGQQATVTVDARDTTAPTARLTAPATAEVNERFTVSANGSTDDREVAAYRWDFGDGTTATGPNATHAYDEPGTYVLTLTVRDAAGNRDNATATVTVSETETGSLDVNLTANRTNLSVGDSVELTANASATNVSVAAYHWDVDGDGEAERTTESATLAHTYDSPGTYNVRVTAETETGMTAMDTVTVSAIDDTPPTVVARIPTSAEVGSAITVDASASTDDGTVTNYTWNFGDGTTATGPNVTHTYDEPGTYTVSVTVTDAAGNRRTQTSTVNVTNVSDSNEAPTARVSAPATVELGSSVQFDATRSSDDEGVTTYHWDIDGDGNPDKTDTDARIETTYQQTGTHQVTVTVVDTAGRTDTKTVSVTVKDTTKPTATVSIPPNVTVGESVTITASEIRDANEIAHVCWYVDGKAGPEGSTLTVSFDESGTHTVTLAVRDAAGNRNEITREVTVEANETSDDETTSTTEKSSESSDRADAPSENDGVIDTDDGVDTDSSGLSAEPDSDPTTEPQSQTSKTTTKDGESTTESAVSDASPTSTAKGDAVDTGRTTTDVESASEGGSSETTTPSGTSNVPGFGVGAALAALLMALFARARRQH